MPDEEDLLDIVRGSNLSALSEKYASVVCPHCGSLIDQKWKPTLNKIETARWVADMQTVDRDGTITGEAMQSSIASYWLGGVAAGYQKWDSLILRYLQGLREFAMSGSDLTLKATTNTDQGMPYTPRELLTDKAAGMEERVEDLPRFYVPDWARFMIAAVDVQGGKNARFVVQVHAIGQDMEQSIVDRYDITDSLRGEGIRIDPAGYPEDWDAITEKVLHCTYKLHDGMEMMVFRVGVDLGGEAGVTPNAQAWLERIRVAGLASRVALTKGAGTRQSVPVVESKLTGKTNRLKSPYLSVSTDYFKDQIAASKRRSTPGPAFMHLPSWLKTWWFDELNAEVRGKDGKWRKVRERNETLDLWVIVNAVAYSIGANNPRAPFSWDSPPRWASRTEQNPFIVTSHDRRERIVNPAKPTATPRQNIIARSDWSSRL
jgi:phage terminase large subunit GpA-like protein